MKNGSLLHRLWFSYAEFGYWLPEEKPRWWPAWLNERVGNLSGFPPLWVWRPYCWAIGHHDDNSYGSCVICWKSL